MIVEIIWIVEEINIPLEILKIGTLISLWIVLLVSKEILEGRLISIQNYKVQVLANIVRKKEVVDINRVLLIEIYKIEILQTIIWNFIVENFRQIVIVSPNFGTIIFKGISLELIIFDFLVI